MNYRNSSNKDITDKKKSKEPHEEFEERTWRSKTHTNSNDFWIILGLFPEYSLMQRLEKLRNMIQKKIPGEGEET